MATLHKSNFWHDTSPFLTGGPIIMQLNTPWQRDSAVEHCKCLVKLKPQTHTNRRQEPLTLACNKHTCTRHNNNNNNNDSVSRQTDLPAPNERSIHGRFTAWRMRCATSYHTLYINFPSPVIKSR